MEDYVNFEQAIKLKELGFDWKTHAFYVKEGDLFSSDIPDYWNDEIWDNISAPTLYQAQKWLREVKQIIIIPWAIRIEDTIKYDFIIANKPIGLFDDFNAFDTYEQAISAGIDKAIELLKQENNECQL